MSGLVYERVHYNLETLKLTTNKEMLDNTLEHAVKEGQSTLEILDYLLEHEVQSKLDHALSIRMRMASFPVEKRLDDLIIGNDA